MRALVVSIALALAPAAQAGDAGYVDAAPARAAKAHQPVLPDFSAPWCYSCYFMETHVLNGAEWDALARRGHAAEALPWLEKAADKAYGANRLGVATQRVKALKALGRGDDARQVVADVLGQNGAWFPDQVAQLKAAL